MDMGPMGEYPMYKNGEQHPFMLGGMMKKPDEVPVSMWSYYFRVPDIDAAAKSITGNGGQVLNGPMEVPGDEYVINGLDPQGAMFSVVGVR
jgi:predicted enzyme related to lactoylglutathione lyase